MINISHPPEREEMGIELVNNLEESYPQSDFITIHVPLNDETRGLISKPQLALMKPTAILVRISMGEVVNEKDLFKALANKRIGGACIDVYSKEPATKEDFPFITLDNVIATPHLGASTRRS